MNKILIDFNTYCDKVFLKYCCVANDAEAQEPKIPLWYFVKSYYSLTSIYITDNKEVK